MDKDRRLCYLILKEIKDKDAFSNLTVGKFLKKEDVSSPAFVRELVYGILRNEKYLDYNINRYLKKQSLGASERILLRMGFYQLVFMNGVADHAAVNETVEIAKAFKKGSEKFINAVLRSFQRDKKLMLCPNMDADAQKLSLCDQLEKLSVRYSCDKSIAAVWLDAYGLAETEKILAASLTTAPVCLRTNIQKISREELIQRLSDAGIKAMASSVCETAVLANGPVLDTREYSLGLFSVQGESSQLAVEILAPKKGDVVFDMCSAPGGKSFACAERMQETGKIYSFDLYEHRAELVKKESKRLGHEIISVGVNDASVALPEYEKKADCVICDVPCSGLGTLREKPELKLKAISNDLPDIQQKILQASSSYVKDGGKLLYSSCTINPRENEEVISVFLDEIKGFEIEYEKQLFTAVDGPDGFYICLLRRI